MCQAVFWGLKLGINSRKIVLGSFPIWKKKMCLDSFFYTKASSLNYLIYAQYCFPLAKDRSSGELPYHSYASCKRLSFTNAKPCSYSVLVGLREKVIQATCYQKQEGSQRIGLVWWTPFIFTKETNLRNKLSERNSICLRFVFSFHCECCVGTLHWSIHHTLVCGPWYPIFLYLYSPAGFQ